MTAIVRAIATVVALPYLPEFGTANAYPLSRIRKEVLFSIAQRIGELSAVDAPLVNDWINDAYIQVQGMMENRRATFSSFFVLPTLTETVALPAEVDQVHHISTVSDEDGTYQLRKIVDIEQWRALSRDDNIDNPLLNYFVQRDNEGLLLQFLAQTATPRLQIDGLVKPPKLVADTDCPALDDALCLGMTDLAISIAMRRLGEHTYSGVQNNAALGVIRSHIDTRGQDRRGTVAAVTRPRTLEEARRPRAT